MSRSLPSHSHTNPVPVWPASTARTCASDRVSVYAYGLWQLLDSVRLTTGVSCERLEYPVNLDLPLLLAGQLGDEIVRDEVAELAEGRQPGPVGRGRLWFFTLPCGRRSRRSHPLPSPPHGTGVVRSGCLMHLKNTSMRQRQR
jgi:hypothetical protein